MNKLSEYELKTPFGVITLSTNAVQVIGHQVSSNKVSDQDAHPVTGHSTLLIFVGMNGKMSSSLRPKSLVPPTSLFMSIAPPEGYEVDSGTGEYFEGRMVSGPGIVGHFGIGDADWFASFYGVSATYGESEGMNAHIMLEAKGRVFVPVYLEAAWTLNPKNEQDEIQSWLRIS